MSNEYRSILYYGLALFLRKKFDKTRNCEALDEAIEMTRKNLELRSIENQDHSTSLQRRWDDSDKLVEAQGFTRSATERSEVTDNEAMRRSTEVYRNPLEFQPSGVKFYADLLEFLANSLYKRFEVRGNAQDSTEAIRLYKEELHTLPTDDPDRCAILENLSEIHMARYEVDGDMQDLDEAIALLKVAEDTCSVDSERRTGVCAAKALTLLKRYELHQDEKYLDEAMSPLEQALDTHSTTYLDRRVALQRISHCLQRKFESSGEVIYLDRALHLARELKQYFPSDDIKRYAGLGSIAGLLHMRYDQTRNEQDIDDAIAIHSECLQLTPPDHPSRHTTLSNLGTAKFSKYERSRDVRDLDEVMNLFREALQCCPKSSVTRGDVLGNLACALGHVYRHSKLLADLNEAITMFKEALGLFPPNHVWRLVKLSNYAGLCKDGYIEHGRVEDFQEALDRYRELESSLPAYHPLKCEVRAQIAELHFRGHNQSDDSIRKAVLLFRGAVQHVTASAESRFNAARIWINSARLLHHTSIVEAYSHAMSLLERRLLTNPTAELQHRLLAQLPKSFASDAVASVIEVGDVETVVELLEQGRGLLWTQLSRYNNPLDALEKANPDLAVKFKTVSRRLEKLALSSNREASSPKVDSRIHTVLDKQMEDLHSLSKEWEEVVEQIRKLDGFSDFLRAVPFAKLRKAAAGGPVIIVNVSRYRCDAIIIRNGQLPVVVPLSELTENKVEKMYNLLRRSLGEIYECSSRLDLVAVWSQIIDSISGWFAPTDKPKWLNKSATSVKARADIARVLQDLWKFIVGPVVAKLQELSVQPGSRIWWCPTNALCHLPLHAAGTYQDQQPNLPDIYISSYLVTLSGCDAVRHSTLNPPEASSLKPPMLVIACPGQEGASDFLYNVEEEVAEIVYAWMKGSESPLTHLEDEDASYETVLSQLPHHPWVHFSCHGMQHPKPLESSFKLQDGRLLTLVDLMRARVENAELAFLSACNTATGDIGGTPDEGLHLAAAMQYCGFKSVVGTLWPMADDDGPDVARDFYGYLLDEGKGDCKLSAAALHHAVLRMRERNVPIDRWINFVHYGA